MGVFLVFSAVDTVISPIKTPNFPQTAPTHTPTPFLSLIPHHLKISHSQFSTPPRAHFHTAYTILILFSTSSFPLISGLRLLDLNMHDLLHFAFFLEEFGSSDCYIIGFPWPDDLAVCALWPRWISVLGV